LAREKYGARERQDDPRDLNAEGTAVGLLAEEESLVERTHDSPDDHRDAGHDTDATVGAKVLESEQPQPQDRILGSLDERDRHALAHLARVVDAEPLMSEVAAAVHHELRSEDASECPPGDERGHERVSEARERTLGPPSSLQIETNGKRHGDAPEAREPALPDGDPTRGMIGVVVPIGRDVGQSRSEKTRHNQGERKLPEGLDVERSFLEAPPGVEETDVGRDGETEPVRVKDEGTEVKRSGDAGHG
jgi:hypothetical protein